MADLDAFFKKKEEKKKKKKKGVMDINSLAEKLQKAVTEEAHEEEEAAEKAANQEEFRLLRKPGEDSDWHDYVEQPADLLEGLKVKTMDYDEKVEAEDEEREAEEQMEAAKTEPSVAPWTKPAPEDDEDPDKIVEVMPTTPIPPPPPAPETDTKKSYVPPSQRRAALGVGMGPSAAPPDLDSEELFPTLDDADKKAKEIQAEMKKMENNRAIKAGAGKGKPTGAWGKPVPAEQAKEAEAGWTQVGGGSDGKYRPGMLRAAREAAGSHSPTPVLGAPPSTGPPLPSGPSGAYEAKPQPTAWRTEPAPAPATNAWRPSTTPSATAAAAAPKTNRYVPPSMRQSMS